jgi:hypothetical protein
MEENPLTLVSVFCIIPEIVPVVIVIREGEDNEEQFVRGDSLI